MADGHRAIRWIELRAVLAGVGLKSVPAGPSLAECGSPALGIGRPRATAFPFGRWCPMCTACVYARPANPECMAGIRMVNKRCTAMLAVYEITYGFSTLAYKKDRAQIYEGAATTMIVRPAGSLAGQRPPSDPTLMAGLAGPDLTGVVRMTASDVLGHAVLQAIQSPSASGSGLPCPPNCDADETEGKLARQTVGVGAHRHCGGICLVSVCHNFGICAGYTGPC